jgi:outer membrane protein assembly factor BamB
MATSRSPRFAMRRRAPHAALLFGAALLAACGDDADPVAPPPAATLEPAASFRRLVVTDAQNPTARLVDVASGTSLETYTLAGPASYVYTTNSGRYAVLHQRTQGVVNFVDAGVWAQGDVAWRRSPQRLAFEVRDSLPTHANVNQGWVSVFFDGSGLAQWMRESDKLAGNPRIAFQLNTGGPHHSGSATLVVGGQPFFIAAMRNPAGGLPTTVAAFDAQGNEVARVDDCPVMHGNTANANGVVFGCQDGMVIVKPNGASVSVTKHTFTAGEFAGLGVRNAYAETDAPFLLGQLSAPPGQPFQRVLAAINPATATLTRFQPLDGDARDHWRALEGASGRVSILGTDGALYVYNGLTGQRIHRVANVTPAIPTSGATTHQVVVADGVAYVASPSQGEVVEVDTQTGSVTRRLTVGGAPSRLALAGARESREFRLGE